MTFTFEMLRDLGGIDEQVAATSTKLLNKRGNGQGSRPMQVRWRSCSFARGNMYGSGTLPDCAACHRVSDAFVVAMKEREGRM